jgi:hypothetical protein
MAKVIAHNHMDKLGQPLAEGDCVAYPQSNTLYIGTITNLNPKMVKVVQVGAKSWYGTAGTNKYPNDLVKLDGESVTMYLLKNSK